MKTLTTACAVDEAPRSGTPGRPSNKPALNEVDINTDTGLTDVETDIDEVDSGSDTLPIDPRNADIDGMRDGTLSEWAEEIIVHGHPRTVIHHRDGRKELLD